MPKIDAIRLEPASFDPYQGRCPGGGFGGNDYAIRVDKQLFDSLPEAESAYAHPFAWVVLRELKEVPDRP